MAPHISQPGDDTPNRRATERVADVLADELGRDWQTGIQICLTVAQTIAWNAGVPAARMQELYRQAADQVPDAWYTLTTLNDRAG